MSKEKALEALDILWNQSGQYLFDRLSVVDKATWDQEYDARYQAYQTIARFIESAYIAPAKINKVISQEVLGYQTDSTRSVYKTVLSDGLVVYEIYDIYGGLVWQGYYCPHIDIRQGQES